MNRITKAEAVEIGEVLSSDFSYASTLEEFQCVSQSLLMLFERKIGKPITWQELSEFPTLASELKPAVHSVSQINYDQLIMESLESALGSLYFIATYLIEVRSFTRTTK